MLADVDCAGTIVWGANAVNGMINLVSCGARDTLGSLLNDGGNWQEIMGGMRYGGQAGSNTSHRVFADYWCDADYPAASGESARDAWSEQCSSFRLDRFPSADTQRTWQAEIANLRDTLVPIHGFNFNIFGHCTRRISDDSSWEVQAYLNRISRNESQQVNTRSDTLDLTIQHTFVVGTDHNVIPGGGYQHIDKRLAQTHRSSMHGTSAPGKSFSALSPQHQFQPVPSRLTLTLGDMIEHNGFTGWEFQPSVRAVVKPMNKSTVWSSWSRAGRTPATYESKDVIGIQVSLRSSFEFTSCVGLDVQLRHVSSILSVPDYGSTIPAWFITGPTGWPFLLSDGVCSTHGIPSSSLRGHCENGCIAAILRKGQGRI